MTLLEAIGTFIYRILLLASIIFLIVYIIKELKK